MRCQYTVVIVVLVVVTWVVLFERLALTLSYFVQYTIKRLTAHTAPVVVQAWRRAAYDSVSEKTNHYKGIVFAGSPVVSGGAHGKPQYMPDYLAKVPRLCDRRHERCRLTDIQLPET